MDGREAEEESSRDEYDSASLNESGDEAPERSLPLMMTSLFLQWKSTCFLLEFKKIVYVYT